MNLMLVMKPEGVLQIYINDLPREYPAPLTLAQLSESLHLPEKGIAIAVDQSVIPRKDWAHFNLENNQKVLVIQATQGG